MRPPLLCLCGLLGAGCSLTIYPPAPGDEVDATAHLSIDGRELPLVVEPGSGKRCDGHPALPSSRARFASDGAARAILSLGATRGARLRAAGRDVRVDATNGSLAFVLDRPDHYALRVAGRRFYFWVDPPAALARPAGAASYDAKRRPGDWLARALDAGPVALEAGLHRSPAFLIPPRGELHLAPGAVLRYDGSGGGAGFVTVRGENVTVGGVGTIDASDFGPGHNLLLDGATHVRVRDVFFTKSRWWALRIRDCDDVALDRVKVFSGTDGVDVDASRDVSIRRAFVHAWDDAIAIKATVAAEARGVLAEHCLVSSRKSAFKIGTETLGDIRDVTVRRCDAFETARGVLMVGKDGGRIGDVLFEDISIQLRAYADEPKAGRPIVVELMRRLGSSRFRNVVFRRVRSDLRAPLYFGGNARTALSGIRLVDVELAVAAAPSPTRSFLAECSEVAPRGVASENLTVRWNGFRRAWAGVSDRGGGADCGSLWVATVHTAVETWRRSGVAPALRRRFGRDDAAKRKSARAEMASRVREGAS